MPATAKDDLWQKFNESIRPALEARKLACVVFQFHLSQTKLCPDRLLDLRARLTPEARMAVEFRCRDLSISSDTHRWLAAHGMALVAADELEHETVQRDREQRGLPPGEVRMQLPTRLEPCPWGGGIIRVHRRHGTTERILTPTEIAEWVKRISKFPESTAGPVLVLWGTDWRDAALENAKALAAALPERFQFDWVQFRKKSAMAGFFQGAKRGANMVRAKSALEQASPVNTQAQASATSTAVKRKHEASIEFPTQRQSKKTTISGISTISTKSKTPKINSFFIKNAK